MRKRILTLDDLYNFCRENKLYSFNSEDCGYKLSVQTPAFPTEFNYEETENDSNKGLMRVKFKVCHTLLNRNGSFISEDNMKKALPTLNNRPILGTIHQLENGEWDFYSHNMEIDEESGEINYIEKQIGSFTSDKPYLEYDAENDKTYVIAEGVIPESYTKAAEIMRRKKGCKVSCELSVDSFQYNAKEGYLELLDFYFTGVTCLGVNEYGVPIEEGMVGSRVDILDFSEKNNSMFIHDNSTDVENNSLKEGGVEMENEIIETVITEEEKIQEPEVIEEATEEVAVEAAEEPVIVEAEEQEEIVGEPEDIQIEEAVTEPEVTEEVEPEAEHQFAVIYNGKTFDLSYDEITEALYRLVNITYSEADNTYYSVEVFEGYVVMRDWCNGRCYKQTVTRNEGEFALEGERVQVYANYLTAEEEIALKALRTEYDALVEYKANIEHDKALQEKMSVLNEDVYAGIAETEEYKDLVNKIDEYSLDEVKTKVKVIYADNMMKNIEVSEPQTFHRTRSIGVSSPEKTEKKQPYGTLFKN